jgi:hypothetical protein
MGIRFKCPNGHKINVKAFLAGKRALCPECGAKVVVPFESQTAPTLSAMPAPANTATGATTVGANGTATVKRPAASASVAAPASTAAPVVAATIAPAAPLNPAPIVATAAPVSAHAPRPITSPSFNANLAAAAEIVSAPVIPGSPAAPPGSPDPIAEAPQAVWYVRPRTGGQFGPAPGDIFRQWIAQRRVTADSLVWRDGWTDWRVASEVLPQLAARTPPAFAAMPGAAMPPSTAVVAPDTANAPAAKYLRARRSRSSTIVAICVLGVVAIALVGVLIFVLNRAN